MFGFGMQELLIIMVIFVVLFGGSKLPTLGSSLGQGISNFKKSMAAKDESDLDLKEK